MCDIASNKEEESVATYYFANKHQKQDFKWHIAFIACQVIIGFFVQEKNWITGLFETGLWA